MATPVTPNFTPFTNTRILWADVGAVNNFFSGLSFTITPANLPEATLDNIGAVKQLQIVAPVAPAIVSDFLTTIADDGATQLVTLTQTGYTSLVAQVDYLKQYIEVLYGQLNAKGYVGA